MPIYISKPKSSGGSAWLQAKEITVGTTDQTVGPDPGYDGLSSVLVHPTPLDNVHNAAGTPTTQAQTYIPDTGKHFGSFYVPGVQVDTTNNSATPTTSSQTKTPDSGKFFSSFTVGAIPTLSGNASESDVKSGKTFYGSDYTKKTGTFEGQEKSVEVGAGGSATVLPDAGKYLTKVSVTATPQQHSETYTPAVNTASNDMGAIHNKRYVNTSGMIVPSGTKSITSNGTVDVSGYASAEVSVTSQTQELTVTPTGDTQEIVPDSGKLLSKVTVNPVPVDTEHNSTTAATYQKVVRPDSGKWFSNFIVNPQEHSTSYTPAVNKSDNDMGSAHSYRYVNTSGMIKPSGSKSITSNGTVDVRYYDTAEVAVESHGTIPNLVMSSRADYTVFHNMACSTGGPSLVIPAGANLKSVTITNNNPTDYSNGYWEIKYFAGANNTTISRNQSLTITDFTNSVEIFAYGTFYMNYWDQYVSMYPEAETRGVTEIVRPKITISIEY